MIGLTNPILLRRRLENALGFASEATPRIAQRKKLTLVGDHGDVYSTRLTPATAQHFAYIAQRVDIRRDQLRLRDPQRTDQYKAFRGTYHTPRLIITEPHLKFVKEFEPMDAFAAFLRGIPTFAREVPRFSAFFRQKCGPI